VAAQPHTNLTGEQQHLLRTLYQDKTNLTVDDLPYTEDLEKRIHPEFVQQTGLELKPRDVFKALKNLGRRGLLGRGKRRLRGRRGSN
jgi:hypothetical protein